jgi:hypothetical protein
MDRRLVMDIRKAAEDARDAGMIRAHVRIPDLLTILDERDRLADGVQALLDDAWITLPAHAVEHLQELVGE